MNNFSNINIISSEYTIFDAIKRLNQFGNEDALILFAINEYDEVLGSLSDGDIRRALVEGITLQDNVLKIINKNFYYIDSANAYIKLRRAKEERYKIVPYLDKNKKIIDLIDLNKTKALLPLDAVIMAGGKGVRLQPYTNTCPKPMLELDEKPIIGYNIDRLIQYGVRNFYISVNYLKDQIIDYISENYKDTNISTHFIEENEPYGTLGSVSLVENFINNDILVMNADILTNIDFEDFYVNYKKNDDAMSVATFNTKVDIPYGVLETEGNYVKALLEKPSYTYYSNAGIYIIQKSHINKIPKNTVFNATDFMELLIEEGQNVSHFPIRGYWLDIGNASNYSKAQDDVKYINF